jgi:hypothetical protein
MRWVGHVALRREGRDVYRVFFWGEHEGKRPLGRPRRRWEDNIKMDLLDVGCGGMFMVKSVYCAVRTGSLNKAVALSV